MAHKRLFGLDMLRAYAVLAVLYGHAYELIAGHLPPGTAALYWLPVWDGVTLFFVLSGFLIGRILFVSFDRQGLTKSDVLHFWLRRWTRTLPPYYAVLTLTTALWICAKRPIPTDLYQYYVFMQNWNWPHPEYFAEAWSLSVEEWFYLTVPLGFYAIFSLHFGRRHLAVCVYIVLVIGLTLAYRAYVSHHLGAFTFEEWDSVLRKRVTTRMDSLMLGVLGAYLSLYRAQAWQRLRMPALALGCLLLLLDKAVLAHAVGTPAGDAYLAHVNLLLTPLAFLLLFPFFSTWQPLPRNAAMVAVMAGITWISTISYSLYLVNHTLVRELLFRSRVFSEGLFHAAPGHLAAALAQYTLYLAVSFAAAYVVWLAVEKPVMAYREKWWR